MGSKKQRLATKKGFVARESSTGRYVPVDDKSPSRPSSATAFAEKFYKRYGEAMSTLSHE